MLSTAGKRIGGWREARDDLCREGKMRQQVADLRHVRPAPRDVQHVALRHQHAAPAAAPEKVAAAVRQRKTSGRHRGSAARGGERPLHTHGSWVGTDSVTVLRAPPALQVSLHRRMQTTQAWYVGLGVWGSAPRALVLHRQEGLADRRIRGPDPPALGARRRGRVSLQLQ